MQGDDDARTGVMLQPIGPGHWQLDVGGVNVSIIDHGSLTLIDTGTPGSEITIVKALETLKRRVTDVGRIVVTHCHPDHAGGIAALKRLSGATVLMHPIDAALVRRGQCLRHMKPAPGLLRALAFRLVARRTAGSIEPAIIEEELDDGAEIDLGSLGTLRAVHVPGHCAGQIALLWPERGLLFAADAAVNVVRLTPCLAYENYHEGMRSLQRLAALKFESACFGHGEAILAGADSQFRERFRDV